MGLRYRGRTKGKAGWINYSYSKKNGFNMSLSAKAGPFTWNSGNGKTTKRRITTNLPGGFYHVTDSKSPSESRRQSSAGSSGSDWKGTLAMWIICIGFLVLFYNFGFLWAIGFVIASVVLLWGRV